MSAQIEILSLCKTADGSVAEVQMVSERNGLLPVVGFMSQALLYALTGSDALRAGQVLHVEDRPAL